MGNFEKCEGLRGLSRICECVRVQLWDHPIPLSQKQVRIIELIVRKIERKHTQGVC